MGGGGPDWARDGADWPHRRSSRFVRAGGVSWHVQCMGSGPVVLLLHGTGAATHSWRDVAPALARRFRVIVPDLPGHGFSRPLGPGSRVFTLPGMAAALSALLQRLDVQPSFVVAHSAGAAVAARMCLDGGMRPQALYAVNGVLMPFPGAVTLLFSTTARMLSFLPGVAHMVAWRAAQPGFVEHLLRGTGSVPDARGVELYGRLVRSPGHVAGALRMMLNWDLEPLARDLPRLPTELVLLVGENDRTVPPAEAARVQARLPAVRILRLPGLGHLAHEERPETVVSLLQRRVSHGPDAEPGQGDDRDQVSC
ncbi:alpha/beta fold hydrolase BchO [Ectothiorhodospira mobilis]|uniref:alpha/beta fold hydrolase BchO n=1 Tax=Ectothiorhodospira mobilis TaxID=195064 RepID=UPI001EE815F6|nr:alpha/beta fold hydrolase BchO [Ectothiorhodospira mobilis]MCG5535095.1 alpha/beta fold hydrolase [Ectothiorhodospira mobilis]